MMNDNRTMDQAYAEPYDRPAKQDRRFRQQKYRSQNTVSCLELCGRTSCCGNTHCSNHYKH